MLGLRTDGIVLEVIMNVREGRVRQSDRVVDSQCLQSGILCRAHDVDASRPAQPSHVGQR